MTAFFDARRRTLMGGVVGSLAGAWCTAAGPAHAQIIRSDYDAFIDDMVLRHGVARAPLRRLLGAVKPQPAIVRLMNAPSTAQPWYRFRPNHVDALHIDGGERFWLKHATTLMRAARVYGVPEEIMCATVGIETHYGGYTGNFRIIDALATLAFDYPKRADFFRGELEEFVLMGNETGLDLAQLRGSYAGAMGMPQFLPSSYRKYAVDFDGDGRRDLWRSVPDIVGSVANYYRQHEWQRDGLVAMPARLTGEPPAALLDDITPRTTIAELRKLGVEPAQPVSDEVLAALLPLETESGLQYWLGFQNFYVITRYNRSTNYAMAVYEIAQAVRTRVLG